MTTPNIERGSLAQQVGSSADGISLLPSAFQRTMPTQAPVPVTNTGSIIVFSANNGAASNSANNVTAQTVVALTTADSIKANLATTDMILAVSKPTAQAGTGIAGWAANAADTIQVVFANPTAANVALTANQTYYCAVARGLNQVAIVAGSGLAANLAANSTVEQIISVAGSGAAATALVNTSGQVVGANVTAQGSMYMVPPAVVFTGTGTGATALATVSGGGVTSVIITNGGSGYTAAPVMSFVGGTAVAPGMFAAINQTTANIANLCIGNVRVAGPNQIGVQFVNPTTANIAANANMTFNVIALPSIPVSSPIIQCSSNVTSLIATGTFLSNISATPFNNITANDTFLALSEPVGGSNSNHAMGAGSCAANVINMSFYGNAVTPAAGVYTASVHRNPGTPPLQVYSVYLAPSSVANNTTAEQVFTLPSNIALLANSAIGVNKPSYTPSISIVGCRANSTTTLGITFMNTSSAPITPPAENYILGSFTMPTAVLPSAATSNATTGAVMQVASITMNQNINLTNELQQALQSIGAIKGS